MLKAQLHIHTKEDPIDGGFIKYTTKEVIDYAAKKGFEVLSITCHNKVIYSEKLQEYATKKNILLIPGVEKTIQGKHVLIYNVNNEDIKNINSFVELKKFKRETKKPSGIALEGPTSLLQIGDEIYIGEGKRDQIHHILGKLETPKLTKTAEKELKFVIEKILDRNQTKFVEFFNKAQPLTTRMHQIELLPGLGKKHMWEIIEERRIEPFKDFEDLKKRVKLMPDPKKVLTNRIIKEIVGDEKHLLFIG